MIDQESVKRERSSMVRQSNFLIRESDLYNLSQRQHKIVSYLISQIQPWDDDFHEYHFCRPDFCRVCGIHVDSGKNYKDLWDDLQDIASIVIRDVKLPDGRRTILRWIEKPYMDPASNEIIIRMDRELKMFLLQLHGNYTEYELFYILHFRSKYSIRLYQLIKEADYQELKHETSLYCKRWEVEELKRQLRAEKYTAYKNFKQRVLQPAVKEISEFSDKYIDRVEEIRHGHKIAELAFYIGTHSPTDRLKIQADIVKDLDRIPGQLTLFDAQSDMN